MGQILEAVCACGFDSGKFFAGGGMRNHESVCSAPALCSACRHFFTANYFDKSIACPQCKSSALFYDDPTLSVPSEGDKLVFTWHLPDGRAFKLPDTSYTCPECGEQRMRFRSVGAWD